MNDIYEKNTKYKQRWSTIATTSTKRTYKKRSRLMAYDVGNLGLDLYLSLKYFSRKHYKTNIIVLQVSQFFMINFNINGSTRNKT